MKVVAFIFFILLLFDSGGFSSLAYPAEEKPPGQKQTDIKKLITIVNDARQSDKTRIKIAGVLADLNDEQAITSLFDVIKSQKERAILRAAITRTLIRSPQKEKVAVFLNKYLENIEEAPEVRAAAVEVIGQLKASKSRDLLLSATSDKDPNIRLSARLAILELDGEDIEKIKVLISILEDNYQPSGVRAFAARRLGELSDPRLTPLIHALKEESPDIHAPQNTSGLLFRHMMVKNHIPAAAARALGNIGNPQAIPHLISFTNSESLELRAAVFEALAKFKAKDAMPAAQKALLSDSEYRVRRWAAFLLREIGNPESLPDLRTALKDTDPGVRLQAAQAIGNLKDCKAIKEMEEALAREENKEVSEAMEKAIQDLKESKTKNSE